MNIRILLASILASFAAAQTVLVTNLNGIDHCIVSTEQDHPGAEGSRVLEAIPCTQPGRLFETFHLNSDSQELTSDRNNFVSSFRARMTGRADQTKAKAFLRIRDTEEVSGLNRNLLRKRNLRNEYFKFGGSGSSNDVLVSSASFRGCVAVQKDSNIHVLVFKPDAAADKCARFSLRLKTSVVTAGDGFVRIKALDDNKCLALGKDGAIVETVDCITSTLKVKMGAHGYQVFGGSLLSSVYWRERGAAILTVSNDPPIQVIPSPTNSKVFTFGDGWGAPSCLTRYGYKDTLNSPAIAAINQTLVIVPRSFATKCVEFEESI